MYLLLESGMAGKPGEREWRGRGGIQCVLPRGQGSHRGQSCSAVHEGQEVSRGAWGHCAWEQSMRDKGERTWGRKAGQGLCLQAFSVFSLFFLTGQCAQNWWENLEPPRVWCGSAWASEETKGAYAGELPPTPPWSREHLASHKREVLYFSKG